MDQDGPADLGKKRGTGSSAVVAVGSNIDPERNILRGLHLLSKTFSITAVSTWYRSPALGEDGAPRPDPDFINGAVAGTTRATREQALQALRRIEAICGRVRGRDRFAPRTLDLDLVVHGGRLVDDVTAQAHVTVPVAEVAPDIWTGAGTLAEAAATLSRHDLHWLSAGPLAAWRPQQTL